MRPGVPRLPPGASCTVRTCPKKPRVETREHDPREPAASCGSLGGPPPAWNQPGPPGLAPTQEAPGGNPGTPGVKTIPPSMPHHATQFPGSNPHRMAPGMRCNPVSPGSRRGLFVPFAHVKPSARLENAQQQKPRAEGMRMASRGAPRIPSSDDSDFPAAAPAWPPRPPRCWFRGATPVSSTIAASMQRLAPRKPMAKTTVPSAGASEMCALRPSGTHSTVGDRRSRFGRRPTLQARKKPPPQPGLWFEIKMHAASVLMHENDRHHS